MQTSASTNISISELHAAVKALFPGCEVGIQHSYQEEISSPEHWGAMVYSKACECCKSGREVVASAHICKTPERVLESMTKQAAKLAEVAV